MGPTGDIPAQEDLLVFSRSKKLREVKWGQLARLMSGFIRMRHFDVVWACAPRSGWQIQVDNRDQRRKQLGESDG